MGWALADVRYDRTRWRLTDRRVNADSPALTYRPPATEPGPFLEYVIASRAADDPHAAGCMAQLLAGSTEKVLAPADAVVHQPEYGLSRVLLVVPPFNRDWVRYDDPIDHAEAKDVRPRVRRLPYAPFPFDGMWMDADTGTPFVHGDGRFPALFRDLRAADRARSLAGELRGGQEALDTIAQKIVGIATWADAVRRVVPAVPDEVVAVTEWAELFTGPDVVRQMRPVIYTHWS
jgi:hypothetical protein